jgi:TPR repeat protein
MRLLKLLLVLLVWAAAVPAVAGPFEDGADAYRTGDYATALRLWRPLADAGNANAQFRLGVMYHNGQGVPQDYAAAAAWYRKAAEQGNKWAQYLLGVMYGIGQGVPQDYVETVAWYRRAAEQGHAFARYCHVVRKVAVPLPAR